MTVIITMAGAGSRFTNVGYGCPKYQIKANGISLFEWSLKSLEKFKKQKFIFACLYNINIEWLRAEIFKCGIKNFDVKIRKTISSGQAETAYDVIKDLDMNEKSETLWIFNIDTYIQDGMSPSDILENDGYIYVSNSTNPNMSYVKHDKNNYVTDLAEKKIISNLATVGMYGFKSLSMFVKLYEEAYIKKNVECIAGEQYILPMYSIALKYNMLILSHKLQNEKVIVLGTPEELLKFDARATPQHNLNYLEK